MISAISQFTTFTTMGPRAPNVLTWDEFQLSWFLGEDLYLPDGLTIWAYPINWVIDFNL